MQSSPRGYRNTVGEGSFLRSIIRRLEANLALVNNPILFGPVVAKPNLKDKSTQTLSFSRANSRSVNYAVAHRPNSLTSSESNPNSSNSISDLIG